MVRPEIIMVMEETAVKQLDQEVRPTVQMTITVV